MYTWDQLISSIFNPQDNKTSISSNKASSSSSRGKTTSSDWNNVILPPSSSVSSDYYSEFNRAHSRVHRFAYEKLQLDLRPGGAHYEAVVQAKNKFGWSQRSEMLRFSAVDEQKERGRGKINNRRPAGKRRRDEEEEHAGGRRGTKVVSMDGEVDVYERGSSNTNSARTSSSSSTLFSGPSLFLRRLYLAAALLSILISMLLEDAL